MIKLQNIDKSYRFGTQSLQVLNQVNLTVNTGEMLAIVGPSGSGKSTLMNILGLLDHPDAGKYYLNKKEVHGLSADEQARMRNKTIGFVFQSFFLLSRLTALQNVMLPLSYRRLKPSTIKKKALEKLKQVGMQDFVEHKPNELSGGQQQRVAIARALVGNPHMILADEPTGALDSHTSQDVMNLLIDLNRKEKATVIIVSHDENVAKQCNRIIRVEDGNITE